MMQTSTPSGTSASAEAKPDNPAAFPATYDGTGSTDPGLTLRDYFAAKAMQSLLIRGIHSTIDKSVFVVDENNADDRRRLAFEAYDIADAMLSMRARLS